MERGLKKTAAIESESKKLHDQYYYFMSEVIFLFTMTMELWKKHYTKYHSIQEKVNMVTGLKCESLTG